MLSAENRRIIVVKDSNAIQVGDIWYAAMSDCEKNWHKYSKAWHRSYGPVMTYSNRRVIVGFKPACGDLPGVFCNVIISSVLKEYTRWPAGGELGACVACIPFEDLLLLTTSEHQKVRELVLARMRAGK